MLIRIYDFDLNGVALAGSGQSYAGETALAVIDRLNSNPFTIGLSPREFMARYLERIGDADFALPPDPEEAALVFLQRLVNRECANFELDEGEVTFRANSPELEEGEKKTL